MKRILHSQAGSHHAILVDADVNADIKITLQLLHIQHNAEIQGDTVNAGDIVVYDKQVNGFKVKFTGSAASVDLKLYVHGGNAA